MRYHTEAKRALVSQVTFKHNLRFQRRTSNMEISPFSDVSARRCYNDKERRMRRCGQSTSERQSSKLPSFSTCQWHQNEHYTFQERFKTLQNQQAYSYVRFSMPDRRRDLSKLLNGTVVSTKAPTYVLSTQRSENSRKINCYMITPIV